jgi:hypothetical protein
MALQNITNISVDFNDKKYILVNAKQYDKGSRFISVSCYEQGRPYVLYNEECSAYIRFKKSNNYSAWNTCEITSDGKVLVELTEQMLASVGICYADLVIVYKGTAKIDSYTGEITAIEGGSVLSTMIFCIDVSGNPADNSEFEDTYEYNGLNDLLIRAEADYSKDTTAYMWICNKIREFAERIKETEKNKRAVENSTPKHLV